MSTTSNGRPVLSCPTAATDSPSLGLEPLLDLLRRAARRGRGHENPQPTRVTRYPVKSPQDDRLAVGGEGEADHEGRGSFEGAGLRDTNHLENPDRIPIAQRDRRAVGRVADPPRFLLVAATTALGAGGGRGSVRRSDLAARRAGMTRGESHHSARVFPSGEKARDQIPTPILGGRGGLAIRSTLTSQRPKKTSSREPVTSRLASGEKARAATGTRCFRNICLGADRLLRTSQTRSHRRWLPPGIARLGCRPRR